MKTLSAFFLPLAWIACAQPQPMAGGEPAPVPDQGTAVDQDPVLGGPNQADSLVILLQRTPCFGQCKAYILKVYRSGYATYDGRANVELEGLHQTRIDLNTLRTLLAEAERNGFYQLNEVYDRDVTDLPSSIMRLVGNGKDKRVAGRVGTPESFTRFFARAEDMLIPGPWKPVPKAE